MIRIALSFFILNFLSMCAYGQQTYFGTQALYCGSSDDYLYSCNGQHRFCQSFLLFNSQPPYNSVQTISNLTSSSPKELARINNVTESAEFPTNKEVIVPMKCSCTGQSYQANTTIVIGSGDTYSHVAEDIYQSLSTCSSLMHANPYGEMELQVGVRLQVPLRCSCPTKNQTANGTMFLLTYQLQEDDSVDKISERFNVSKRSLSDANRISEDTTIFSDTTILIPLPTEPSSAKTIIRENHNPDSVTKPPATSIPRKPKSNRKLYTIIGIKVSSLLLLGLLVSASIMFCKKRTAALSLRVNRNRSKKVSPEELRVEIAGFDKTLHVFGFEEIKRCTENFSPKNQIKGSVYQGAFGKDFLAIKKVKRDASKEVNILKKINHYNLIKLEGVCRHHDHFYLVFEYMENLSLREWLCRNNSEDRESWSLSRRIQIALDVAHGLNYLHSFTEPAYVHKNIESSNILLNKDTRAKIANFSQTSETTSSNQSSNTHVMETRGYLAPEYLSTGIATPKIDVYAYGVVILELMTGRNAVTTQDGKEVVLSVAVAAIMEGENPEEELDLFMESCLRGHKQRGFVLRVMKLSVACLKVEPENRPSMGEVVSILLKIQADLHKIDVSDV
ncbi:hypothetical protein UlMin_034317 [Ulmus minor]